MYKIDVDIHCTFPSIVARQLVSRNQTWNYICKEKCDTRLKWSRHPKPKPLIKFNLRQQNAQAYLTSTHNNSKLMDWPSRRNWTAIHHPPRRNWLHSDSNTSQIHIQCHTLTTSCHISKDKHLRHCPITCTKIYRTRPNTTIITN